MRLIEELDDYIFEERNLTETEHSYIFISGHPGYEGKPLTYHAAYDKLKKIQKQTGLSFNFHDLRHGFCSRLAQTGMDVSIIRLLMGHEHIATTQRYTHLSGNYIEVALSPAAWHRRSRDWKRRINIWEISSGGCIWKTGI